MVKSPTLRPTIPHKNTLAKEGYLLELLTDSVFSVGIRSVFLGNYRTDTEGNFGL